MSHLGWRRLRLDKDNIQHETPHSSTHGHALILSGPPGKGGAAHLAARGRSGSGQGSSPSAVRPRRWRSTQLGSMR